MSRRGPGPVMASMALFAALLALGGCAPSRPHRTVVNFSLLSADSQREVELYWKPVLDDLAASTGYEVHPFYSPTYGLLVEAMGARQTDAGWFSALPAVEAIDRSGGEVFARTVDDHGRDYYTSVILARKGSGLTLDRLLRCDHSLNFGLGDPKSTSGTLAPLAYLFNPRHIDPRACFRSVHNAEHSVNMMAVANGVVDAATNNSTGLTYYRMGSPETQAAVARTEVIWESPPLPESAILFRKDLDPEVKQKIADFFTRYGTAPGPEGDRQRAVLKRLKYSAFRAADNRYLAPIREMKAAQEARDRAAAAHPAS